MGFAALLEPVGSGGKRNVDLSWRAVRPDAVDDDRVIVGGVRMDGADEARRHLDESPMGALRKVAEGRRRLQRADAGFKELQFCDRSV